MENHISYLKLHCRICGGLLARCQQTQEAATYAVTGSLKDKDDSVPWHSILLDLEKFKIDTIHDDPEVHPSHFCRFCYMTITASIKNPNYTHRTTIAQFGPHSEVIKDCVICKQHLSSRKGRPSKPKRGGSKPRCELLGNLHLLPLPESIKKAQKILLSRCRSDISDNAMDVEDSQPECTQKRTVDQSTSPSRPETKKVRGKGKKKLLSELERESSRKRRLKPYLQSLHNLAKEEYDDINDVFGHLRRTLPPLPEDELPPLSLTPLFCLSMKSTAGMTDSQYKTVANATNKHVRLLGHTIYAPPHALRKAEMCIKPGYVKFELIPSSMHIFPSHNHLTDSERCKSINLLDGLFKDPATLPPNIIGERFRYDKAVAQTLSEYEEVVQNRLNELKKEGVQVPDILDVTFKDGADGLGDVDRYKGITFRPLPTNALRHAFSLLEISFNVDNRKHLVYRAARPNSGLLCRTLLSAIADENDPTSSAVCLLPVEREKRELQGKVVRFLDPKFSSSYRINIITTMVDEKLERHYRGLDIPASNFGCTLCFYNKSSDQDIIETVPNEWKRTWEDTEIRALKRKEGGWRSKDEKDESSKGVRAIPLMTITPVMDATHADINVSGNFIKKIYIREIANIRKWEESDALDKAKNDLDEQLRKVLGNPQKLMQGGNYGKDMVNVEKIKPILQTLIHDQTKIDKLLKLLDLYNKLRRVWRANYPKEEVAEDLEHYKARAHELGELLRQKFEYIKKWPNYLHKILAHVPEIIESNEVKSCGAVASEANEERNKGWRENRRRHSRKNLLYEQTDNLRYAWLSSSYRLHVMAKVEKRGYRCGKCLMLGHNSRTRALKLMSRIQIQIQILTR
ncbi:V(D)J recombination-activating protein 1-like [Amphiura filiformis]|uniref:V(D)J recombination-activating protein 1-like n=1 Tax=Amphiura filiformis TaxID=82378 RepID=UPI003B21235E